MDSIADPSGLPRNQSATHEPDVRPASPVGGLRRTWVRMLATARYDRLEGAIKIADQEIERRAAGEFPSDDEILNAAKRRVAPLWATSARALLAQARAALAQGKIDQGWRLLHAARRTEILAMADEELAAYVAALREEAAKLKSWRQKAVHALVGTAEAPRTATIAQVCEAALTRDEHYNNQGYKDQLVRTQILFLVLILAATMAGILGLASQQNLPLTGAPPFSSFLAVTMFGILGGTVSAMLRASDTSASARIPEITAASRVTFMRILMGGASAMVIMLAMQSQLTAAFNADVAATLANLRSETTYVVAFVSGFSERLVLRAVEHVAGKPAAAPAEKDKSKEQQ